MAAAYVLDASGTVVYCVGYAGSEGRLCRSDLPEVEDGIRCATTSPNPLQAALDFAAANGLREVRLDAGEYTFDEPQPSHTGRIGFYVPSNIHLKGVMHGAEPATVLMPSAAADTTAEERTRGEQRFEVLVLPSGSRTDRSVPLVNTTIEAVQLNNRCIGGVCLWASGGTGFRLLRVHSMGSRQSSLIVGHWDSDIEDPEVKFRASIYYARGFEIGWCQVHTANGDGICVIGKAGVVHDCLCENGTTTWDNGLTTFIGSECIRFRHNRVISFPVGIGLDGAFMPCRQLPGMDPAAAEKLSNEKLWELYHGREGYHRDHEIDHNRFLNCRRGIILHRATGILIHDNVCEGRAVSDGLSLEEADGNRVWANRVSGFEVGCRVYAHQYSATNADGSHIGASGNVVGLDMSGAAAGNDLRGNQYGVLLVKAHPEGHVSRNVFRANDCRDCGVPFDFTAGDGGPGRQFSTGNLPAAMNFPANPQRVQGRAP